MDIIISKENGILTIEFNRPDKKNAITYAMYQMMADSIKAAQTDKTVRVILFCGKPDIFTAGNDLKDFQNRKTAEDTSNTPTRQFTRSLFENTKVAIAAVAGNAIGIGTTLLFHCDLVYAADNAKFAMPFAKLGMCPEFGSSMLMPLIVGYQRAAEKLMLGEPFSAQEAYDMGMVNKILKVNELIPYAKAQAVKLAELPPTSIRITKALMKKSMHDVLKKHMEEETDQFAAMVVSPEAKEAFNAFYEKRKPDFSKFG